MAFTVTARHVGNSGTSSVQTVTTDSVTPTASSLLIAGAGVEVNSSTTAVTPLFGTLPTGGSLTYTQIAVDGEATPRPWGSGTGFDAGAGLWRAPIGGSPSAFAITFDLFDASAQAGFYAAVACDITGHNATTPEVQNKANGGTINPSGNGPHNVTVTLDSTPVTGNLVVVLVTAGADGGGTMSAPTIGGQSFTQSASQQQASENAVLFYRVITGAESDKIITCADLGTTVGNWNMVAVEIASDVPAPTGDPYQWTPRQFAAPVPRVFRTGVRAPLQLMGDRNTTAATNAIFTPPTIVTISAAPPPTAVQTGSTFTLPAIATTAAMPAPTLLVQTVVTPPAIATTTALPAPTVQTGSTISAVSIAVPVALPAPTLQTGSTVAATAIVTTTALPAPTVSTATNATVSATAIATTTALPAPTVSGSATVAAVAVATTTAMPAPTLQTGSTVSAISVATIAALPVPVISASSLADANQAGRQIAWMFLDPDEASFQLQGSSEIPAVHATVTPPAIATATALPAPGPQTGSSVSAAAIATTTATPAPTLQTGSTIGAGTINTLAGVPAPAIAAGGNITITAVAIATVTALPAPTVQTGSQISATSIATVAALPAPAVVAQTVISPSTIATVTALPAPTLQTGSRVSATTVATVTALPAPTVAAVTVISPSSIATVTALPAPTVKIGSTVSAATVATVIALPAPNVSGTFSGIKGRGHGSSSSSAAGSAYPPSGTGTGTVYPRSDGGIIGRAG